MNKLYFIVNSGCDATTHGIARIADEDFDKFKTFIENLNRNSYYGCMPTIAVYEIDESKIKEINFNPRRAMAKRDMPIWAIFFIWMGRLGLLLMKLSSIGLRKK